MLKNKKLILTSCASIGLAIAMVALIKSSKNPAEQCCDKSRFASEVSVRDDFSESGNDVNQHLEKTPTAEVVETVAVSQDPDLEESDAGAYDIPNPEYFNPALKPLLSKSTLIEEEWVALNDREVKQSLLYKTPFKYEHVRVDVVFEADANGDALSRSGSLDLSSSEGWQYKSETVMVGDHMIVKKSAQVTDDAFMQTVRDNGLVVRSKVPGPDSQLFLIASNDLSVDSIESISSVMQTIQSAELVDYYEPDHLAFLQNTQVSGSLEYHELNSFPTSNFTITEASTNDPDTEKLWGIFKINMPAAWSITKGSKDAIVAVIDTGVDYNHEDLAANIWVNPLEVAGNGIDDDGNGYVDDIHGYDFYSSDNDPMDQHMHGTHVAGTIAAVGNNAVGVVGVSQEASIMALQIFSKNGFAASSSDIAASIRYATANGAALSNNSWGGGSYSQTIHDAIKDADDNDVLFIAAAANDANNNDARKSYPNSLTEDNIISVMATGSGDHRASFSNYGLEAVDLGAPGVNIFSTVPGNQYGFASGTSMAAPHVAGAAFLLKSYDNTLTGDEIKSLLLASVDTFDHLEHLCVSGGRMNVYAAFAILMGLEEPVEPTPVEPVEYLFTLLDQGQTVGGNNTYEYIDSVSIEGQTITVKPGFSFGSYNQGWAVYLDYNNEYILLGTSPEVNANEQSFDLKIPASVQLGSGQQIAIRVFMQYQAIPGSPTDMNQWGEVKDLTAEVEVLNEEPDYMLALGIGNGNHVCGNTYYEYIESVVLNDDNSLMVTPGFNGYSYNQGWAAYVFDKKLGEWVRVGESQAISKYSQTFDLIIPDSFYDEMNEQTTLRVFMKYHEMPESYDCSDLHYGEIRDYDLFLVSDVEPESEEFQWAIQQ